MEHRLAGRPGAGLDLALRVARCGHLVTTGVLSPERALHLARAVSAGRNRYSDPDHDDIVQEAAIRILEVAAAKPDMPESYLAGAGRQRTRSVIQHRTWTGMATSMGTPVDPLRKLHDSIDEMMEAEVFHHPGYVDPGYEMVEARSELEQIVSHLPDEGLRQLAQRRAEGEEDAELDERWGEVVGILREKCDPPEVEDAPTGVRWNPRDRLWYVRRKRGGRVAQGTSRTLRGAKEKLVEVVRELEEAA